MKTTTLLLLCVSVGLSHGFISTQDASDSFQQMDLESLAKTYPMSRMLSSSAKADNICLLCDLLTGFLIGERRSGMTVTNIMSEAYYVCTKFKIEEDDVCMGILESMINVLAYIVDHNNTLSGSRICALVAKCHGNDNYFKWTIDVPPETGKVERPKASGKTFKVLHITDPHYDPNYTEGKQKNCHRPVCCQKDQEWGSTGDDRCGAWGEYGSDTPLKTIVDALVNAKRHDFDYVYVTGDIVSHRVWSTGQEYNSKALTQIFDLFSEYFPKQPVYHVVGNHEAHPVNQFAPLDVDDADVNIHWLYKLLANKWSSSISVREAENNILKGGYYSLSPRKGLRLVVINNNVCITENWWLLANDNDPYGQLKWLAKVLLQAEKNKERVHLLTHVPTGTDYCISSWSHGFNQLIERFANTIAAQFYGHAHKDEFYVFYSKTLEPINIGYNGASVVPDKSNPSYKIFEIDDGSFEVVDYEEWTFNLTAANQDHSSKNLNWYKLYSFKNAYGVKDMSPESLDDLLHRMAKDHRLIDQYFRFMVRNGDVSLNRGCNSDCQKGLLCQMAYTDNTDNRKCQNLLKLYDENS